MRVRKPAALHDLTADGPLLGSYLIGCALTAGKEIVAEIIRIMTAVGLPVPVQNDYPDITPCFIKRLKNKRIWEHSE